MGAGMSRGHMCRAVLEGIAFAVRSLVALLPCDPPPPPCHMRTAPALRAAIDAMTLLASEGGSGSYTYEFLTTAAPTAAAPPPLPLVGGCAQNEALAQTVADVLQRTVLVPQTAAHVPALGAAALAAAALSEAEAERANAPLKPTETMTDRPGVTACENCGLRCEQWALSGAQRVGGIREYTPRSEMKALMDDAYERYCALHPSLRDVFVR
uniref:Carbohydrate kinase FGGY C-terminal domain-containing protein n=1 Tax=Haptolina brevifila TaxID=156173 RepID=A0A7S2FP53_9EUKA|mmetsp:Transcript_15235/g.30582  ORF Transcript_15235/g.30582 Transcript_15235/m.30582 type:complete len:211 (+) Transcript_15235:23-655(+)